MLLIGFGEDHVVPAKVSRHQEAKYDDEVTITEYKLFEGRPHFPGAPGWKRSPTTHSPGRSSTRT